MGMRQYNDGLIKPIIVRRITMATDNVNVANQSILESCSSSLLRLDADGSILSISHDLCQIAGIDPEKASGETAATLGPILDQLLKSESNAEITSTDGHLYHFTHTTMSDRQRSETLHVFTNISTVVDLHRENQRLQEEAKQLQLIDQDTSLLTKRALLLILEAQVSRCRRYETPLSIIMLDMNYDTDSTDLKLKLLKISRMLKDQLRWSDMISRSADNQFTIILPETEHQACISLVNKLKDTIKQWNESFSVSFGLTEWEKGVNASDLLSRCEVNLKEKINNAEKGQDVA